MDWKRLVKIGSERIGLEMIGLTNRLLHLKSGEFLGLSERVFQVKRVEKCEM